MEWKMNQRRNPEWKHSGEPRNNERAEQSLTEGRVELVQAEMPVVVVVVVAQQVLHGALQQAVLQVLLHGDLQTEAHSEPH